MIMWLKAVVTALAIGLLVGLVYIAAWYTHDNVFHDSESGDLVHPPTETYSEEGDPDDQ